MYLFILKIMLRALTTRFQYVLLLILVRTSKDPVRLVFCSTDVFFKRGIALGLSSECQSIWYVFVL